MRTINTAALVVAYACCSSGQTDEQRETVRILDNRVVDVLNSNLGDLSIDEERLSLTPGEVETWDEAAALLDEHAPTLDVLCDAMAQDHMSFYNQRSTSRISQVLRVDAARAIQIGDRERATRRLVGLLDMARHLMRDDELLIGYLHGSIALGSLEWLVDQLGTAHYDSAKLSPALKRLVRDGLTWTTLSSHQAVQTKKQETLRVLFAAAGVDPGDLFATPNAVPRAFEGTWSGDMRYHSGDDRFRLRGEILIERHHDDATLARLSYTNWLDMTDCYREETQWTDENNPFGAGDDIPDSIFEELFRKRDEANDTWVRVIAKQDQAGETTYDAVPSTHFTLFPNGRLELIDLSPMGLSASGLTMSLKLNEDGSMFAELLELEAKAMTAMPAPTGLWTGVLKRVD